ncbi:MAG: 7-carboxy-7-deazaguanine synthase QueE [Endomicrobia bacterium]|nr:7-carboxy-7-deazaguanine synthase QueE [Endomicrobiia bacterium]
MINVREIFFSYQAEGKYIGSPTVFIRFSGCNLRCIYCDTKSAIKVRKKDKTTIKEIISKIQKLVDKYRPMFISLTGGEPLLQRELPELLKELTKNKTYKIYLETNASIPERFKSVINLVDVCAVNIKLPKDDRLGKNVIQNSLKVISLCKKYHKDFIVKLVVTGNIYDKQDMDLIKKITKMIKLNEIILQPETYSLKKGNKNVFINICNIFNVLYRFIPRIHIIPQLHKFIWRIK